MAARKIIKKTTLEKCLNIKTNKTKKSSIKHIEKNFEYRGKSHHKNTLKKMSIIKKKLKKKTFVIQFNLADNIDSTDHPKVK